MHTVLSVSEIRVQGKPYHRLQIPIELSRRLNLQARDTLTLEIKAVKRDGVILYSSEAESHAE